VIWHRDRLDFALLQRRLTNSPRRALALAAEHPASFMVFDVLADDWQDLRFRPLAERRDVLERLGQDWGPPLQISPATTDGATALDWATEYRPAGIEGVMVKAAAGKYRPGRRDWIKVRSRESSEVIIGAVTGPLTAPETVVVGLLVEGRLAIVGRSVTLTKAQARSLTAVLRPAAPEHPWPAEIATRFGAGRDKVQLTKVEPVLVAEILADAAMEGAVYRHPVRFVRHRPDLTITDIAGPSGP
jgi:ATP-dependent DNA ligase